MYNRYTRADLPHHSVLDATEQGIIITVNVAGVAGRGVALDWRLRYPDQFKRYKTHCKSGTLGPNNLLSFKVGDRVIILFPTKTDWRAPSTTAQILSNLIKLEEEINGGALMGLESLAMIPLGQANGWLSSQDCELVDTAIERFAHSIAIPCNYYK